MGKKSFWQKITGSVPDSDFDEDYEYEEYEEYYDEDEVVGDTSADDGEKQIDDTPLVQELPVDVYEQANNIIIEAFIPGVPLDNLDIELSREVINISGSKNRSVQDDENEYFYKELDWGAFSRTIMLPEEIDIDASTASESAGVLKIILPKFNKSRKAKLTVKSHKK